MINTFSKALSLLLYIEQWAHTFTVLHSFHIFPYQSIRSKRARIISWVNIWSEEVENADVSIHFAIPEIVT